MNQAQNFRQTIFPCVATEKRLQLAIIYILVILNEFVSSNLRTYTGAPCCTIGQSQIVQMTNLLTVHKSLERCL